MLKTIKVYPDTHARLRKRMRRGESFDAFLNRLIEDVTGDK